MKRQMSSSMTDEHDNHMRGKKNSAGHSLVNMNMMVKSMDMCRVLISFRNCIIN